MGFWWWPSSSTSDASSQSSTSHSSNSEPHSQAPPSQAPPSQISQPRTQNEDESLTAILPMLPTSEEATSVADIPGHPTAEHNDIDDPDVPYPSTMSCREAFDMAYHCQSISGQFLNVYRYGERRQCKEHWAQFWFCMRNRQKPADVKAALIKNFYKQKEEKYGRGPSCEDVWNQRSKRVEKAFDLGFEDVELLDTRRSS